MYWQEDNLRVRSSVSNQGNKNGQSDLPEVTKIYTIKHMCWGCCCCLFVVFQFHFTLQNSIWSFHKFRMLKILINNCLEDFIGNRSGTLSFHPGGTCRRKNLHFGWCNWGRADSDQVFLYIRIRASCLELFPQERKVS